MGSGPAWIGASGTSGRSRPERFDGGGGPSGQGPIDSTGTWREATLAGTLADGPTGGAAGALGGPKLGGKLGGITGRSSGNAVLG